MLKCFFCFHFRQGKFYTIELSTKDRRVFPPSLIKKQLEKVVEMAGGKEERLEKEREEASDKNYSIF